MRAAQRSRCACVQRSCRNASSMRLTVRARVWFGTWPAPLSRRKRALTVFATSLPFAGDDPVGAAMDDLYRAADTPVALDPFGAGGIGARRDGQRQGRAVGSEREALALLDQRLASRFMDRLAHEEAGERRIVAQECGAVEQPPALLAVPGREEPLRRHVRIFRPERRRRRDQRRARYPLRVLGRDERRHVPAEQQAEQVYLFDLECIKDGDRVGDIFIRPVGIDRARACRAAAAAAVDYDHAIHRSQHAHLRGENVGRRDRPGREHQHRAEWLDVGFEGAEPDADFLALQHPIDIGRRHVESLHDRAPMLGP